MIRNLKILGLAMAAMAAFAVSATAASAQQGEFTSDGPFTLVGTELAGNSLTYPGLPTVTCSESHFKGGAIGSTPHKPLPASGASATTVTAEYTNCLAGGVLPVTVDMNGCDYEFELGETTEGPNTYALDASLACNQPTDRVKITVFTDAGTHENLICTVEFGPQTPVSTLHATDLTNGSGIISGSAHGIKANHHGPACGEGSTAGAAYNVNVELTGENAAGGQTDVGISHEEI